jgi:hypothetical protein
MGSALGNLAEPIIRIASTTFGKNTISKESGRGDRIRNLIKSGAYGEQSFESLDFAMILRD